MVAVLEAALESLAPKGMLGLVGIPSDPRATLDVPLLSAMTRGITVRGITEGDSDPQTFIPELVELYRTGKLPLDQIITTFPMAQINEAVLAQHAGEVVKVVLIP